MLGSDGWGAGSDFNPRTPRGVRRCQPPQLGRPYADFNPRTPRGVRLLR